MPDVPFCELESLSGSQQLLKAYDSETDSWRFPKEGPFWESVKVAHRRGLRGQGRKVAIIDSGCNTDYPRLKQRVDCYKPIAGPSKRDIVGHGTAVSLLISEIAPDCTFDIYKVVPDSPEGNARAVSSAVLRALELAIKSDADVINMSLGIPDRKDFSEEELWEMVNTTADDVKARFVSEMQPCQVCKAATSAWQAGKLVFAAAGNTKGTLSCPARAEGVTAVGYRGSQRKVIDTPDGVGLDVAYGISPRAPQATLCDVSLDEIPGVLGTSFASPLFSGVGALGLGQQDLFAYLLSIRASWAPQRKQGEIREGRSIADAEALQFTDTRFANAWSKLVHGHCDFRRQPNQTISDPKACGVCGFFVEPLYVNYGLWLSELGRWEDAIVLLRAAIELAPWSPDAHANLGAVEAALGNIVEAIDLYKIAIRLRPDYPPYVNKLKELEAQLANKNMSA